MTFKVGDKVRVKDPHYTFNGEVGTIQNQRWPNFYGVVGASQKDPDYAYIVYEENLELVEEGEEVFPTKPEAVNNPAHYGTGKIECIEYIKDFLTPEEFIGYLRGNIAKYLHRWRYKNGLEDLKKSEWYLKYLIEFMQETK